jgi:hypothetical protein
MIALIADIIVACLLATTIYFCWRLDRYMKILRDSRSELSAVVYDFTTATTRAQTSINELKNASSIIADKLQVKIEKAEFMADDLAYIIEKANKTADLLTRALSDATGQLPALKPSPKESPKELRSSAEPQGIQDRDSALPPVRPNSDKRPVKAADVPPPPAAMDAKPRSKAELDLLQALKSIR